MTQEHHDRLVIEDRSSAGPIALVVAVVALVVVLWLVFSGEEDTGDGAVNVDPESVTTLVDAG